MSDDQKPSTSKGSDLQEQMSTESSLIISTEQENTELGEVDVRNPSPPSQIFKDKRRVSILSGEGATVKNEQSKEDPEKPSLMSIRGQNQTHVAFEDCPKCYAAKSIKNCGESCKTNEPSTQSAMTAEPDPLCLEPNKPQIDVKFCIFPGNRRRGTRGDCPAFAPASQTERRPATAPAAFQLLSREEDARALAPFLTRSEQQLLVRLENPPQIQAVASNTTWDLTSLTGDPRLRALLAASNIGETGQGLSGLGVTGAAALAKATGLRGFCQCGPPTVPEDPFYRDARGMLARALRETARKRMVCVPMEIDCGGASTLNRTDPAGATNWDWLMQTQRSCPLLPPQGLPQTTAPMLPPDINMPFANPQSMGNRPQFQAPRQAMDPMIANFYNRGGPPQFMGGYQPPPPQYNQQNPQNPYYQPQTQTFGTQTQTNTNYPPTLVQQPPPPPSGAYGQQTYGQQTQTVYAQPGMQNQPNMMNPNTGFMSTQTQQTGYGQGLGQAGTGVSNVNQGISGQGLGNFGAQGQTQGFGTQTQGIGTQGQNFGGQTQAYSGQASQGQYMPAESFANIYGAGQPSYPPQYPPPTPGGYPGALPPLYPQPFGQTQQQQQPAPYQPYGQSQQSPYAQPYGQSQQQQQPAPYPQQGFSQPGGQYGSQSQYGNPYQGHQMQQSPYINQPTTVYTCAPSYPPYPGGATGCCPQWIVGVQPCPMQSYAPSTNPAQSSLFGSTGAASAPMHQHYSEVTATTQVEGSAALALLKKMTSTLPATDELGQQQHQQPGFQKPPSCWCGPPDPSQVTPVTSQQQPPPPPPASATGTISSPMLPAPPGTSTNAAVVCPGKLGLQPGAFCSPLELTLRSCWRTAEGVVTACERTITCAPSSPAQQQQRSRACGPQSLAALSLAVAVRDRRLCLWPAALGATPQLTPPPPPPQNKNINYGTGPAPGTPGGDPPTVPPLPAATTLSPSPTTQLPPPVTLNTGPWLT